MNDTVTQPSPSIVVVSIRKGMVEGDQSNIPVSLIIEDWDQQDGEYPRRFDLVPEPLGPEHEADLLLQFNLDTHESADIDEKVDALIDDLLEARRQVAIRWSIEDVQEVRSDLNDDQAWVVLRQARQQHDADAGINWTVLEGVAEGLFGLAPDSDEA